MRGVLLVPLLGERRAQGRCADAKRARHMGRALSGLDQPRRVGELLGREGRRPSKPLPCRFRRLKPRLSPFSDKVALKLRERAHDMKHHAACAAAGVDLLGKADKVRACGLDALHDLQQVGKAPAQSVEAPHNKRRAVGERVQRFRKLGPPRGPAGLLLKDRAAPCRPQCVELGGCGLLVGGDSRIANFHRLTFRRGFRARQALGFPCQKLRVKLRLKTFLF